MQWFICAKCKKEGKEVPAVSWVQFGYVPELRRLGNKMERRYPMCKDHVKEFS